MYKWFNFCRIPDALRDIWAEKEKITWKKVKKNLVCSLHFEKEHFVGRKLNMKIAKPTTLHGVKTRVVNQNIPQANSESANQMWVGDHDYASYVPPTISVPDNQNTDVDHDYARNVPPTVSEQDNQRPESESVVELKSENAKLKASVSKLQQSNYYLRRKQNVLKKSVLDLQKKVKDLQKKI